MVESKLNYKILIGVGLLAGLYLTRLFNYLLFHSLAEMFSIVIACSIFTLVWNSRHFLGNSYLLLLGIAYLFIGSIDLFHTLAYKGMGVFPNDQSNLATQLWIAGRYLESISLVVAPCFMGRKLKSNIILVVYFAATCIVLSLIFAWNIFPSCYVEGAGLTPFKIINEYIISCILVVALFLLIRKRQAFEKNIVRFLAASIVLTIGSEVAFTLYVDVYGITISSKS